MLWFNDVLTLNWRQLSGYWNHYKAYNLNLGPYSNLDSYWTPIGINDLSGVAVGTSGNENRTISGVLMNITWTLHYGPSLGCAGFFEAAFVTNDGEYNTLVLLTYQGINNPGKKNFRLWIGRSTELCEIPKGISSVRCFMLYPVKNNCLRKSERFVDFSILRN